MVKKYLKIIPVFALALFLYAGNVHAGTVPFYEDFEDDGAITEKLYQCKDNGHAWCTYFVERVPYDDGGLSSGYEGRGVYSTNIMWYGRGVGGVNSSVTYISDYSTDFQFKYFNSGSYTANSFNFSLTSSLDYSSYTDALKRDKGINFTCDRSASVGLPQNCYVFSDHATSSIISVTPGSWHQVEMNIDWGTWKVALSIDGSPYTAPIDFSGSKPDSIRFEDETNAGFKIDDMNSNKVYYNRVDAQSPLDGVIIKDFPEWHAIYSMDDTNYVDPVLVWHYGVATTTYPYTDTFAIVQNNNTQTLWSEYKSHALTNGILRYYITMEDLGTVIATSSVYTLIIDNDSGASWTDYYYGYDPTKNYNSTTTVANATMDCDPNSDVFLLSLCRLFYWTLVPSASTLNQYTNLYKKAADTPPFSIFFDLKDAFTGISTTTDAVILPSSSFDTALTVVRNMFMTLLYLLFTFYMFRRITRFKW